MSIQNFCTYDPFADIGNNRYERLVHIRVQQRNGRKMLTTVQGLSDDYNLKKVLRVCKRKFACNGTVIQHPQYGDVMQLQGDQREKVCQWLAQVGLAKTELLMVHGY